MEKLNKEKLLNQAALPISSELYHAGLKASSLPFGKEVFNEASRRRSLSSHFEQIFNQIETNNVNGAELLNFYNEMSDFIESDPNNSRIVLYLPFQVLPDLNLTNSSEAIKFANVVNNSWLRLLHESEVRAVYIDGDELEPGMGDPPRIRKAGHLIPELLSRGIITQEEVLNVFDLSDDLELEKSLLEGIIVAQDGGVFDQANWEQIVFIAKSKNIDTLLTRQKAEEGEPPESIEQILNRYKSSLRSIEKKYSQNSEYTTHISHKRAVWEKGVKVNEAIELASEKLSQKVIDKKLDTKPLIKFENVGIRTLFKVAKAVAVKNPNQATILIESLGAEITKKWIGGTSIEKEDIKSGFNQLSRLNVLPLKLVENLKIDILDLSDTVPVDINKFIQNDGKMIASATEKIKKDPELSKYIYPLVLVFGSRIKGYANQDGDFDMAIFIKPEVDWQKRDELLTLLKKNVPELANVDRVLEYWVSEKDGKLGLKLPPQELPDVVIGAPQIHFIWGGVWIGDENTALTVRRDFTEKYLDLSRFGDQKEVVRTKLLRQIELDVLQYRLMHKGFKKLYPSTKSEGTKNGDLIDYKSDFWDPGFRKIATTLFLKKVFLPDLSAN